MLLVVSCLSSCKTICYNPCPVFPIAGLKVAEELQHADYQNYQHTWNWIGRLDKLRQELELCR